ncbi:hypothetical protein BDM02DRAFT_3118194, partial [Thelephora ganbajun]
MVSFSDLPHSGRFVQPTNSTPPDFNLPGPSASVFSFTPCIHCPAPIPFLTDPHSLPFYSPPH